MKLLIYISIFLCSLVTYSQKSDFKNINFTKADNIAKIHKGESLHNLPLLTYKLTHKLTTDVEKFRAIYIWVCNNIKGDYNLHSRVTKHRKKFKNDSVSFFKWNAIFKRKIFKKLLKDKRTMCTGYAYLLEEMAKIANLECKIIYGYGRGITANINNLDLVNHSWNAIKLNNKWYLCDATWSSGYMIGSGIFVLDYNDGYFLTKPNLFARNHFPKDKKWLLDDTINEKEFTNSPLVYSELFKYKLISESPSTMEITLKKNEVLYFKYNTLKEVSKNKISLVYYAGDTERKLKIYDLEKNDTSITFKSKFKRKGLYDIHLKMNNDILMTYTVNVTKS